MTEVTTGSAEPPVHHRRTSCRACGAGDLHPFLALGPTPLANAFLTDPADFPSERSWPLDVCLCPGCSLVQLVDVIDPEVLFREYIYVTGTSRTMAAHNARHADTVAELLDLGSHDLVVEAASNDGSLLREFQRRGARTLGVEPARNIAAMARAAGVETVERFFDEATAADLRSSCGPARAVLGNNVLAHVDDPAGFLRGAATLLADDGLAIIEVPYLGDLLDRLEYDTIYHEHLSYFSVTALRRLTEAAGLRIVRLDRLPVHGGTIRVYAGPVARHPDHGPDADAMAAAERAAGMTGPARWERFAADVAVNRERLRTLLTELTEAGHTIAGYGAPAKGNTLLNYCGIGTSLVPWTVDRSPLKVGTYTPGMHLPVLPVDTVEARRPDYLLLLAWNFAEEIMAQQEPHRQRGGRFILPIPEPAIR